MIKPESLREHITAAVPELRRNPDALLIFVENGAIVAAGVPGDGSLSFEYRYQLTMILTDFAAHPDSIMVPLIAWLHVHQPDLLHNFDRHGSIGFEAEVIANDKIDLTIKLPLTERVGVHPIAGGGGYNVEHYPEPPVIEPAYTAGHWRVYAGGELLAEWDTPQA